MYRPNKQARVCLHACLPTGFGKSINYYIVRSVVGGITKHLGVYSVLNVCSCLMFLLLSQILFCLSLSWMFLLKFDSKFTYQAVVLLF